MKTCTLGFLFKDGKIILAKKKRKFGAGKWNGYGGGIEEGENKLEGLARELEEESGVIIQKEKCKELGYVDFHFENKEEYNQKVYMYRIDGFSGEPQETEEMGEPKAFDINEIPYHEMIIGDDKFIPFIVEDKNFKGDIYFSESGEEIKNFNIIDITNEKA